MADFEDACSPSWDNLIEGQINLKDRWDNKIDFTDPVTKKEYKLGSNLATLVVRPRGWHLTEDHVTVGGKPVSGALFDFALYFFHCAARSRAAGSGPYFLSAEDRKLPGSQTLERRFRLRPAQIEDAEGHHQGDRADRDAAGSVRDGRNPL